MSSDADRLPQREMAYVLYMDVVGTTRGRSFVDRPGAGPWVYRLEVAGNWLDNQTRGDPFVFSDDVTIKPSG